jgi:two-component system response regulator (stage 0 sporulation protein F)
LSINKKILSIVDDEVDITELFRDAICRIDGLYVITFNDSIEALKHFTINKKEYVLVLSDYRMPGLSGIELLKKVKTLNHSVRTVLMSAFDVGNDDKLRKYLTKKIINQFIQKPITIFGLCNEINNQLSAHKSSLN